jgi:hypothetical protein
LAVLYYDLNRESGAADLDATPHRVEEIGNNEIVSLAKCRERPSLWTHVTDLEGSCGVHRWCEYRTSRERRGCRGRRLEDRAPAHAITPERLSHRILLRQRLCGYAVPKRSLNVLQYASGEGQHISQK